MAHAVLLFVNVDRCEDDNSFFQVLLITVYRGLEKALSFVIADTAMLVQKLQIKCPHLILALSIFKLLFYFRPPPLAPRQLFCMYLRPNGVYTYL